MSESSNQSDEKLERSWISWLLMILGVFAFLVSILGFTSSADGFFAGLGCVAVGGIFLALSRILDYLQAIVHHQKLQAEKDSKI